VRQDPAGHPGFVRGEPIYRWLLIPFTMDSAETDQEKQECLVKKDIQNLTRVLTPDNLNPDVMFAKKRGIRSCTPNFGSASGEGKGISDRLKRVPPPESQE
jgi:hypothetical protein